MNGRDRGSLPVLFPQHPVAYRAAGKSLHPSSPGEEGVMEELAKAGAWSKALISSS